MRAGFHMVRCLLAVCVLVAALLGRSCRALHFQVEEGSQRCFLVEIPEQTRVGVVYDNPGFASLLNAHDSGLTEGATMQLWVERPSRDVVLEHECGAEGRVDFTSETEGEYRVCVMTSSAAFQGHQRSFDFELRTSVGERATDYSAVAKAEHLSAIEIEVRKLNDRMADVRKEQDYQKHRENQFRNLTESTNARIAWWTVFQALFLIATGVYSVMNLKAFFKTKKLA
jgi:hypothetical protein